MDLFASQEKTLENYFNALLLTDDGSAFSDAEEVSPLFSLRSNSERRQSIQPVPLEVSKFEALNDQDSAIESSNLVVDDSHDVFVSRKSSVRQPEILDKSSVNDKDVISEIEKSIATEDKFILVRPVTVVGLNLALEVGKITANLPIDVVEMSMASNNEIMLGIFNYQGYKIPVLNTAAIVVPENHPRREAMLARINYQYILVIDQLKFALAVDAIDEAVYLPTDNIRWGKTSSNYGWLAGTMTDYGYALVNTKKLAEYVC